MIVGVTGTPAAAAAAAAAVACQLPQEFDYVYRSLFRVMTS